MTSVKIKNNDFKDSRGDVFMSTLLVIKAHPSVSQISNSMAICDRFVTAYQEAHPTDTILQHDLYAEGDIEIDSSNLQTWAKLSEGTLYTELSANEQILVSRQQLLQEEFIKADKYVFANPMYNLFLPARLKSYLDIVCVATKTSKATTKGPVGLLKDKMAVHIQSSGGTYQHSDNPNMQALDMGTHYLRTILSQMGVTDVKGVYNEGNSKLDAAVMLQNRQQSMDEAAQLAERF